MPAPTNYLQEAFDNLVEKMQLYVAEEVKRQVEELRANGQVVSVKEASSEVPQVKQEPEVVSVSTPPVIASLSKLEYAKRILTRVTQKRMPSSR